jgi:Protein of unknown function (DUF1353)
MKNITVMITCFVIVGFASLSYAAEFGMFSGNPVLYWGPDGRTMVLVQNFTYTDPDSNVWIAAKDSPVNGASIPQIFWSFVGGPFEGKYRNASIVHDTECTEPYKHHWREVHRMFYFASRAGGVGLLRAKVMFAAVYHFGPRWEWKGEIPAKRTVSSIDDFFRMRRLIRRDPDLSLDAIEGLTHDALVAKVPDVGLASERGCGAELDGYFIRNLDRELSRIEFVPGSDRSPQPYWEGYLGCIEP